MNKDRLIQLVCVLLVLAGLTGAAVMVPVVSGQRQDLQLTADFQGGAEMPPEYAIATTVIGPFRGLFVDALWYRAEHLKREGKFFEANTLAQWITTLQPRFPQVWLFNAWNMAYNISVATHTPQERWDWVNKGIRLLREQGIKYNPNSVPLYRELAWIFFHKIGQFSDDMNWYYKTQLAQEWQEILGNPSEGATTQEAIDRFEPIADAADRYFKFDRPSIEVRRQLQTMLDREDLSNIQKDQVDQMMYMSVVRLAQVLPRIAADWREEHPDLADQLLAMRPGVQKREQRSVREPLALLYEDHPEARAVVEQFRDAGFDVNDTDTLRSLGRIIMLAQAGGPQFVQANAGQLLSPREQNLLPLLQQQENPDAMSTVITYMRARALCEEYNMDPGVMLELMNKYGPFDWRHPASHSTYWAYVGVQRSGLLRNNQGMDILNTDRRIIQSLQNLMYYGRVSYNPLTGSIDLLPDPRFIDAYGDAVQYAMNRMEQRGDYHSGTPRAFRAGYENFLHKAIQFSYLYGDEAQAQRYYDKVKKMFGDEPINKRTGRYNLPLPDLVLTFMQENADDQSLNRALIESLLQRAFSDGLGNYRPEVFNRMLTVAQAAYKKYQKDRDYQVATTDRSRLGLPPFNEMLVQSYVSFMEQPGIPLLRRSQIYSFTPIVLRQRAYPRFRETVSGQAQQQGFAFDQAFPAPPDAQNPGPSTGNPPFPNPNPRPAPGQGSAQNQGDTGDGAQTPRPPSTIERK